MKLYLWVCNQDGMPCDCTREYLEAAGAAAICHQTGVDLDGQVLTDETPRRIWDAYVALRAAVADGGHNNTVMDRDNGAPVLTASLADAHEQGAAADLQRAVSPECATFAEFAARI